MAPPAPLLAVEVNLPGIDDDAARSDLVAAGAMVEDHARRADELQDEVRQGMRP